MSASLEAIELAERDFAALVIGNQGSMYSAGFNLKLFLEYIGNKEWTRMDEGLVLLQLLSKRLKYAKIPIVAAVHGYALGGGCEVMLPCAYVHAHVESGIGLPEALVGLIPAGGGTTIMTARATANLMNDEDPLPRLKHVFQTLAMGKRANNAFEAKHMGFLTQCDGICWNLDRLLHEAKVRALALAEAGYSPPAPPKILALGEGGFARLMMEVLWMHEAGQITNHDRLIAEKIAYVMTGGSLKSAVEVSEDYLHELEREVFIQLCGTEASVARIQAMLETGKPLRN
jgi:3-hydroxyacyl-CoA dehydrogenase